MFILFIYLLYKDEKSSVHLSVCPRRAHNSAVSWIGSGLARNDSHVIWNQQVCFEKFLTTAVSRLQHFELWSVEDFC